MTNIPTSATPLANIGGLASGLDTNSIISQLMQIERNPQVRLQQQKTLEQVRQQALRDINTRLLNLQSAATGLRDVGTWGDVQEVDSSDSSKITATRSGGAAAGGYELMVTRLARAAQMTQGTSAAAASADGTLTIQVGSGGAVDVAVTAGDSLQTIADHINGSSGMQAYASVVNGKLVLSGKVTGQTNAIAVTGSSAANFGFTQTQSALDANYTLDGVSKTSASNIVSDAIAGVTLGFKATTATPVSVSVGAPGPDTDAVKAKVQNFIDQYNSTVDFIHDKLTEQRVPNPQNEADREKGLLNGDSGLNSLLSSLREAVSDPVSGRPSILSTLAQAGVSTGAAVGGATLNQDAIEGKLTLDADKLSAALSNNFSDTKALFTNITGSYAGEGLAQRLDGLMNGWLNPTTGILTGRINSEQTTIDSLTTQISDWDTRLTSKEAALRAQFTAMETALSQLQSQGGQLSSQIGALGGGN